MKNLNLSHLNPEQAKAVNTTEKPILILAGAGSGKTGVITYRIASLIAQKGIPPQKVLALTFTNKAAQEMKERVQSILGKAAKGITITTFHSLCVRFLREYIHLMGYQKDFVIFDTASQLSTIKTIFEDEDIDSKTYSIKATHFEIMKAKGKGEGPEKYLDQKMDPTSLITGKVFYEYNKTLKGCNAIDFEDILYFTIDLFKRYPEELAPLKKRYEYIMVDEYQDTNRVQYRLIRHLTEHTRKLCVVGDDDQSIYGWRGADIRNILDFQEDFPETEIIKLEQNYRSTDVILNAANDVIERNRDRMSKKLWTSQQGGDLIRWIEEETPREELDEVVSRLNSIRYTTGASWSDFAFLYRSNFQSRAIEEILRDASIPYQLIGGTKFFDRKEIQDCLAYMRFLHNPRDEVSLFRVVNYPKRDIGKNTLMILTQKRIQMGLSLFEMMVEADDIEELKPRAKKSIAAFVDLTLQFKQRLTEEPFYEVFRDFFEHIDIRGEIEKDEKIEQTREMKVNNYHELINSLYNYHDRRNKAGQPSNLSDFLEYVSLFSDTDKMENDTGKVSLLTVHSAKGLEFDYVAVIGLTDGQFPNHKAVEDNSVEEERRLFYVAVTRARKSICLSMPKRRMQYGEWVFCEPSRFIQEINSDRFENPPGMESSYEERASHAKSARKDFFSQIKEW